MPWHSIRSNDVPANASTGATQSPPPRSALAISPKLFGKPRWLDDETYSLLLLVGSAMFYSVMGAYIKLAVARGIPSTELVFLRAIFQGVLVVLAMMWFRDANDGETDQGRRLIYVPFGSPHVRNVVVARGLIGGLGFLLYYYTISVLPLGDAITLLSLNPIFTVIAGSTFLGETIRVTHVVAAVGSLMGCLLIAQPSFVFQANQDITLVASPSGPSTGTTTGYITAVMGACCEATVYVLIRRAGQGGVHTLQLLFALVTFGIVFSLLVGVLFPLLTGQGYSFVWPDSLHSWVNVLGVCVFGSMGHFLLNYAGRCAPAGPASIVRSSGIMWSYGLEVIVFHEIPQTRTTGGVLLILLSLATVALGKRGESHSSGRHIPLYKHTSSLSSSCLEEQEPMLQMEPVQSSPIMYGSLTSKRMALH